MLNVVTQGLSAARLPRAALLVLSNLIFMRLYCVLIGTALQQLFVHFLRRLERNYICGLQHYYRRPSNVN